MSFGMSFSDLGMSLDMSFGMSFGMSFSVAGVFPIIRFFVRKTRCILARVFWDTFLPENS